MKVEEKKDDRHGRFIWQADDIVITKQPEKKDEKKKEADKPKTTETK